MKYLIGTLICFLLIAVITKPSDQKCFSLLHGKMESREFLIHALGGEAAAQRNSLCIEDKILYKELCDRSDGHVVGYGLLDTIIWSKY